MKFIAKRNTVTAEQFQAIEIHGAELCYTDEEFATVNNLSGTGFVDEATLSYFDPNDEASLASVAAANQTLDELTAEEIVSFLKAQEAAELDSPEVDYLVGDDGLPVLDENKQLIPLSDLGPSQLSDQEEVAEVPELDLEL